MSTSGQHTLWLHDRIDRLQAGDPSAGNDLLRAVGARMERLAHRMLRDYPGVRASAETDDVVQGALLRLLNALREWKPASTRDFANLAAVQVRRELIDLARHFAARGVNRQLTDPATADYGAASDSSVRDLDRWTRFHAAIETLPAEERETIGLIFYHGVTRADAALILGVSERTVYRWWAEACRRLNDCLGGELPG